MALDPREWVLVQHGNQLQYEWHWKDQISDTEMNLRRRSGQWGITKGQQHADSRGGGTRIPYMVRRLEQELAPYDQQVRLDALRLFYREAVEELVSGEYGSFPPKMLTYARYLWYHPEQPLDWDSKTWTCEKKWLAHLDHIKYFTSRVGLTMSQYWTLLFRYGGEVRWFDWDRMEVDDEDPIGPRGEREWEV